MDKTLLSWEGVFRLIVQFYNIQGFRGQHKYSIDDGITIINSKHNGVGKTTLYDCLRFLCDVNQVDKEEQAFFLNLNEQQGLFSATRNGITYGFILVKNKPIVFYKQVEGEPVERSSENFTTVAQDIGILIINGSLLNIFSKEVNLFSGSHTGKDYQLVKELTTHQETEIILDLLTRSININQTDLSNLQSEKRGVDLQIDSMPYYFCISELNDLLNDTSYEVTESYLLSMDKHLGNLKQVDKFDFNSKIDLVLDVQEVLGRMHASDIIFVDSDFLEFVTDIEDSLTRLESSNKLNVNSNSLDMINSLSEGLENLVVSKTTVDLNTQPLEMLETLINQIDLLQPIYNLNVSSNVPYLLSNICIKLGEMITTSNQEVRFSKLAEEKKASLSSVRVACPIREEVYLIDGKCIY